MNKLQFIAKEWAINDEKRDALLKHNPLIHKISDIAYDVDNLLDIYFNKNLLNQPLLIIVHGGGWFYGDKELYSFYAEHLAEYGFKVIVFDYKLSPEYKFPFQINQLNNVLKFIEDNKGKYNFDINNLFLVGDSAGAQMSLQYACAFASKEVAHLLGFEVPKNIMIKGCVLNCGCYYLRHQLIKNKALNDIEDAYLGNIDPNSDLRFKYADYWNDSFPSLFIGDGADDWCGEHTRLLLESLKNSNVSYRYKIYGDSHVQCGHNFQLDRNHQFTKECVDDEANFIQQVGNYQI